MVHKEYIESFFKQFLSTYLLANPSYAVRVRGENNSIIQMIKADWNCSFSIELQWVLFMFYPVKNFYE